MMLITALCIIDDTCPKKKQKQTFDTTWFQCRFPASEPFLEIFEGAEHVFIS
jgi:hypothetical protein